MTRNITITSVVGARPQFVKLAPIAQAMIDAGEISHRILHTGQHYDDDMSAIFFDQLEIPRPDVNFAVGSGSHAVQTAAMMVELEKDLDESKPDLVLVYGDTNSTLAAALVAAKRHVPVAHLEAGLRSFDRTMPEEINRLVADHCSDRLYAPTPVAFENLQAERLAERSMLSGDVMRDAVIRNIDIARSRSAILRELALEGREFGLATLHRAANTTSDTIKPLMAALEKVARDHLPIVFAVHPRTRHLLDSIGYEPPAELVLTNPLPYLDSIRCVDAARILITDSGGMQKEAAFLGTPCLTMRNETEWTETVTLGVNRLVGERADNLEQALSDVLGQPELFNELVVQSLAVHYGAGDAADGIVNDIRNWLT